MFTSKSCSKLQKKRNSQNQYRSSALYHYKYQNTSQGEIFDLSKPRRWDGRFTIPCGKRDEMIIPYDLISLSINGLSSKIEITVAFIGDSERSDECIDFTMIITSRNNAPISNYGGGFRCKSEYP
ncbi:Uncharacterized protein FWK35_00018326 [Aphis craccivora]|uniref:Uncharacterized protein n=1 Tax=Aphis craccivora TaxID=307492 RepID=A0A6G0Z6G3_APHCR|nr:Uncharacterized protein FWK35_00018326 [Aphis craccivora]